ncbi:hypothetical protein MJI12_27135, partial [Salmonella enterica subsp. enterica serovar Kentucky]|nr:hypothetical protein [Salmonella enterica subsp. enterica serovar Kentucky]
MRDCGGLLRFGWSTLKDTGETRLRLRKNVVIIGLGLTGLSCVDFFLARGVTPRVMDTRVTPPGLDKLP